MDQQKASLFVVLQNVEFKNEFSYFISIQLDGGEKVRTDVSSRVAHPVFNTSSFFIPLPNFKVDFQSVLHFEAFVVTDREENQGSVLESTGKVVQLGEAKLELGPLTPVLTDISGSGVRQMMRFQRMKQGKAQLVGKFLVQIKLVGEDQAPEAEHYTKFDLEDIFHQLPSTDPSIDWRIKVDVRCGVDMPLNHNTKTGKPSCNVELGWTLYDKQAPLDMEMQFSNLVETNRHPYWNQQFYVVNPPGVQAPEGFLYFCIRDRSAVKEIDTIYLPIQPMVPFIPYNFEFFSATQLYEARASVYVSIVLEMKDPESFVDPLVDVVIHNVAYDPLPLKIHRMMLVMTTHSFAPSELTYTRVDLKAPTNIAKIIQDNSNPKERMFISTIMKIPPLQVDKKYNACATFTITRKLLESGLMFFIAGRDDSRASLHGMPNVTTGKSDVCDDILQKLLLERDKAYNFIPISWDKSSPLYAAFTTTKCRLEVSCHHFDPEPKTPRELEDGIENKDSSAFVDNEPKPLVTADERIGAINMKSLEALIGKTANDKERWEILSRELAQKQELIHRLIRESDDKTESLKMTGADIVDLRRQIKMLQSENAILRKRLAQEEQIEIASVVTKEISRMGVDDLRAKIVKLAQAYRDERVRNEEFEKSLKSAQKDIAESKHLQTEMEIMQKKHTDQSRRLLGIQQEASKINLFKETIKKQEKVIAKLEKLMEQTLKDTQKARSQLVELEHLKSENLELQQKLKQMAFGPGNENSELERYKMECHKLENLAAELREELKSKRPTTSGGSADWDRDRIELEVKLSRANARVEALQQEMTENARNFAKSIAELKIIISEKQALLDSISQGY
jgi:hypothetical protein